ncbi:uncharacterized protein LOC131934741 [Physella acuta]|uniref:uncharacterized protein LOC131934741 n=1 Tax=Physella acuta TaxID=109671 RepID=UPI0027DCA6EC|nr:uncharacterized protein LOC131934741 [Physella acuta]
MNLTDLGLSNVMNLTNLAAGHVMNLTNLAAGDVMNLTTAQPVQLMTALLPSCVKVINSVQKEVRHSGKARRENTDAESDFGALVYIVVVLVFYSTGVMVMIVRYLKTEKKELEEEAALENFFKYMPDRKQEQEHRVNRVAIHAFHTLTSISYDEDEVQEMDRKSECPTPEPLVFS